MSSSKEECKNFSRSRYQCLKLIAIHTIQDVRQLLESAILIDHGIYKLANGKTYLVTENGDVEEVTGDERCTDNEL